MEKIKKYAYKIMLIILFILVSYVTYCSIFNIYELKGQLSSIVLLLGTVISIGLFISLKKVFDKLQNKTLNKIAIGICVVFFIALIIFGKFIMAIPGYDAASLQQQAIKMLDNGGKFNNEEYFSIYTNQVPATILIYYIYKIGIVFGILNLRMLATVINALFISITAFFTYMSVKKLKDHKSGLITLIFFVLNPIFYIYASYYYTDTLCMPFAAISIYLFICSIKSDSIKKAIMSLIGSGILVMLGFRIRAVLLILPVAMISQIILNNKINKKLLINSGSILIGCFIGLFIYMLISMPFNVPNNKDMKFSAIHWIKIGLNKETDGAWTDTEYKYTKRQKTAEAKKEADLKIIKKRLKNLGVKGYINLLKIKLSQNWSNGQYHAWDHLDNVQDFNEFYQYVNGNKNKFILYYLQICKVLVLLLFTISLAKEILKQDEEKSNSFIYISMFGAFLFYMLWEVMCRYSLSFLPWMMLTFGTGINVVEELVDKIKNLKYKNKLIITDKVEKTITIIFIGVTVVLLISNYSKYVVKEDTYKDKVIVQNKVKGLELKKIGNKKIAQNFKSSKEFNMITIEFLKGNVKSTTHYKFTLYDENKNILDEQSFTSDDVRDWKSREFKFNTQKPNGEREYTFEIKSNDATDDDCIGISSYFQDYYSVYDDGTLLVNDEKKENADLRFMVKNENTRTYTNIWIYLSICVIILGIEICCFCVINKKYD